MRSPSTRDSMADAVNITKVAFPDTPEQQQAMKSLENLLALVEGWVDTVVWRAGMASYSAYRTAS